MENFFLCYECGSTFTTKNDFDEHVFVHQAVSLCYQLYEFDKGGLSAKAKELTTFTNSGSVSQENKLSTVRKSYCDLPRKYTRKISVQKRKLVGLNGISDGSPKASTLKQKKVSQNEAKGTKTSKTMEKNLTIAKESSKADPCEQKMAEKANTKSNVLATSPRDDIFAPLPCSSPTKQLLKPAPNITRSSKSGDISTVTTTTTTAEVTVFEKTTQVTTVATGPTRTSPAASGAALPKCPSCDYRSSQGTDMVEHVVRVHKTSITSLEKTDFVDGNWSGKMKLEPKQQCAFCVRTFPEVTEYFLHVIMCHKSNLLSPGVSKYHCTVHLAHPRSCSVLPCSSFDVTKFLFNDGFCGIVVARGFAIVRQLRILFCAYLVAILCIVLTQIYTAFSLFSSSKYSRNTKLLFRVLTQALS